MPEHDFSALFEKYPDVIEQMLETFSSHEFIQRLTQQNQALYIKALYAYRNTPAPFRTVHSILARHLHGYRERVTNPGDVESENIFGQATECAEWQKKSTPAASSPPSGGVTMGNVTGGIQGSIIAGGDVTTRDFGPTITLGGQPVSVDKEPTVAELKQLLAEIRQGLAEVTTQQEVLKQVSPAAPFAVQGAEQSVKDTAEKIGASPEMEPEEAKSVQQSLTEATSLLSTILDGAKTVAKKTGEVVSAVRPLAEKLEPLVEKLGVAALWVARLWSLKGNP